MGDLGGVRSLNSWKLLALESLSFLVVDCIDPTRGGCFCFPLLILLFLREENGGWPLLVDSADGGFIFFVDMFVLGVCRITITPFLLAFNVKGLVLKTKKKIEKINSKNQNLFFP